MTIKNSGPGPNPNPLSFTEIEAEFGSGGGERRLGKYRRDDPAFNNGQPQNSFLGPGEDSSMLGQRALDTGIPTGNQDPIAFSDFYGKKLNMIIDYYSGSNQNRNGAGNGTDSNQIATWKYHNQDDKVKVIGGFKDRPSGSYDASGNTFDSANWQGGKKIIIHVNKRIGSKQAENRRTGALRTGRWPAGTDLRLDVGSSGEIRGAGGTGGNGGGPGGAKPPTPDLGNGTSALGIQFATHIDNNGIIRCGYGGGGGGSGGNSDPSKSQTDYGRSGGGGGGGSGYPAGDGGNAGTGAFGPPPSGNDGSAGGNGSVNAGGAPGDGGNASGQASGGKGGRGGDHIDPAENGSRGQSPNRKGYGPNQPGGTAGTPGFGIIFRTQAVSDASDGNTNTPGANGGDNVNSGIV